MTRARLLVATAALAFVVAAFLPLFVTGYDVRILNLAIVSAIAVLGLNFAFGYAGLITLAQAGFVGVGAYATSLLSTKAGLPPLASIPLATLIAAVSAVIIGLPILRLKGHYLALATLGFNVSFVILATNWRSLMGGVDGIAGIPPVDIAGYALNTDTRYFYLMLGVLALVTLIAWRIRTSHIGLAMIAVRDDEIATGTSSVSVVRTKVLAFMLSGAYAGLAGALFAHLANFISPEDFALVHSITYLAMLIVGGEGTILGAIAGAVIVTFLPEWLRVLGNAYLAFFGMLILAILIFLPKGLLSVVADLPRRAARLRRGGSQPA